MNHVLRPHGDHGADTNIRQGFNLEWSVDDYGITEYSLGVSVEIRLSGHVMADMGTSEQFQYETMA